MAPFSSLELLVSLLGRNEELRLCSCFFIRLPETDAAVSHPVNSFPASYKTYYSITLTECYCSHPTGAPVTVSSPF